jgi:hypothetical protein
MAQFVLVNVVVAVLMKHLEESHKQMDEDEDYEIDLEIAAEIAAEKKALEEAVERKKREKKLNIRRPLMKMASLPTNFTFTYNCSDNGTQDKDQILFTQITSSTTTDNMNKIIKKRTNSLKRNNSLIKSSGCKSHSTTQSLFGDNILNVSESKLITSKKPTTSPMITIEKDDSNPVPELCSPEFLAPKSTNRKFSDFMDEESATLTHCLLPSYPEFAKDSDQQSLDSVTWSGDADSLSSKE